MDKSQIHSPMMDNRTRMAISHHCCLSPHPCCELKLSSLRIGELQIILSLFRDDSDDAARNPN